MEEEIKQEIKLNFGCGGNRLPGWVNMDWEVNIEKPLPFPDDHADFILIEHCLEHVPIQSAYNFLVESKRILKKGGILRVAVPSVVQIHKMENDNYRSFIKRQGWGTGERGCGVHAITFQHGHQIWFSREVLEAVMQSIGFRTLQLEVHESIRPQLQNVEGHHRMIGEENNSIDTIVVEGEKV